MNTKGFSKVDPMIARRVDSCKRWLCGLHISPKLLLLILSNPERHWRRVIKIHKGKRRVCYATSSELSAIQDKFSRYLRGRGTYALEGIATAYEVGSSITSNAKLHRANRSNLVLDLKNAFESIRTKHIYRHLVNSYYGHEKAWIMSRAFSFRGRIRQGAGISPQVFNFMMRRLDGEIARAVGVPGLLWIGPVPSPKHAGMRYTRYGDDLCFSAPLDDFPPDVEEEVRALIRKHGFRVNERKTRRGGNGILYFPGVVVFRGRILPRADYLAALQRKLDSGSLPASAVSGHAGFLKQFPDIHRFKPVREMLPL